jgi:predicted O-methyltransferase YrrM
MNLDDYIIAHIDKEPIYLADLERNTHTTFINPRMTAGHLQGRFLKMLVTMINPKNILEIGTFTGYSALCFAEGMRKDAHIHTIEINDELEYYIRQNFEKSPYNKHITLHIGDALNIVPKLNIEFDFTFIDADKRLYLNYYEQVLPKMKKGGFIIADNTLWGGKIIKTLHSGDHQTRKLIEFNDFITNDKRVEKVILPFRDGITIIRKISTTDQQKF